MGGNYTDEFVASSDQRISSLRNSLISPNQAFMSQHQQGQQWQGGGDHLSSSSWNTGDTDYGFNNQFQHYQQQQQQQQQQQPQQWAAGQYVQPEQQGFLPQHAGYWPGYGEDHENQQMLANSGPNAMALNQNHFSVSDPKGKNNKAEIDGKMRKESGQTSSSQPPSRKNMTPDSAAREMEITQNNTTPVPSEQLQMKRAAAIASLQKRATSAGASGLESTPSRGASGTPPQTTTQPAAKVKDGQSNGTQRSLFQSQETNKTKRELMSADRSSPVENPIEPRTGLASSSKRPSAGQSELDALKTPSKQPHHSQKQDATEPKIHTRERKASSIDIDGLLAEGRAAAEASHRSDRLINSSGNNTASPKVTVYQKEGSQKENGGEDGLSRRRSSHVTMPSPSSDPSELGEIHDEPGKQRSVSKPSPGRSVSTSQKESELGAGKSQSSKSSNGFVKNPTTKTDTYIEDKETKQDNNQAGSQDKRRFRSYSGKECDTAPQNSRQNSLQQPQEKGEKRTVSKPEPRSAEKIKKSQGLQSRPDRPIYEPTRDPSRYKAFEEPSKDPKENDSDSASAPSYQTYSKPFDTRPSRDVRKPTHEVAKSSFDHSFSKIDLHEAEELKQWLEMTGYYDEVYRRKTLRRHQRLAALEKERAELLQEEQEERGALTATARTQSFISPDASATPGTPGHRSMSSSLASMPPPKSMHKSEKLQRTFSTGDDSPVQEDARVSRNTPMKRRLSASASHDNDEPKPAEKIARTGYDGDANHKDKHWDGSRNRYHESPGSRRVWESKDKQDDDNLAKEIAAMDGMSEERREALQRHRSGGDPSRSPDRDLGKENDRASQYSHESGKMRSEWLGPSEYKEYAPFPGRGRGRGRGRFHRGSYRGSGFIKPHRSEQDSGGNGLDLHLGDVEYFMVKSWTYDNVEASQQEGTWATQAKNIEKFSHAFDNSRHVILVFSVNNSKAFQGYARMESRPGASGVPKPSWAKDLTWQPSPPFRIRWITVKDTRFRYVGHLKNSFNEDEPVLVGRDGQEIEPECGMSLCELIDNEDPNMQAMKPNRPMSYKTW